MLDIQLKEHTRLRHAMLEKKLLRRVTELQSAGDYQMLLSILYGFYSAIESTVQPWFVDDRKYVFDQRRKAWRILDDIRELGGEAQVPDLCTSLPQVNGYHEALGVMYVVEGSTLGGPVIARLIQSRLNIDRGMGFFLAYGPDAGIMWTAFRKILSEPYSDAERKSIVNGAQETFLKFDDWLSIHD